MSDPSPAFDPIGGAMALLPGIVLQRNLADAITARYRANGYAALTQAQAIACLLAANALDQPDMVTSPTAANDPTTEPPYPAAPPAPVALVGAFVGTAAGFPVPEILMYLPRQPDSNPSPRDGLGQGGDRRVVGG